MYKSADTLICLCTMLSTFLQTTSRPHWSDDSPRESSSWKFRPWPCSEADPNLRSTLRSIGVARTGASRCLLSPFPTILKVITGLSVEIKPKHLRKALVPSPKVETRQTISTSVPIMFGPEYLHKDHHVLRASQNLAPCFKNRPLGLSLSETCQLRSIVPRFSSGIANSHLAHPYAYPHYVWER